MTPKKPGSKKPDGKQGVSKVVAETRDEKRAARNVAKIRNKLATAMEDPHMREQIVRAMRNLINEDK